MKEEIIFDLDVYSKTAVLESFELYKTIEGLDLKLVEGPDEVKVVFISNENPKEILKAKNEFSNYVLGLTKESILD